MKTINKKYLLTIVLAIAITAFGHGQKMGKLTKIKHSFKPIDLPDCHAAPCIYDYDGDGLDDLIVGTLWGKFRFYNNIGTKNRPRYKDFSFIRVGGKDARVDNW